MPFQSLVNHATSLLRRQLVKEGTYQCREALIMTAPCSVPWWSRAVALVVCGLAMPGTIKGHALRGGDGQDPSWWSVATQGNPSPGFCWWQGTVAPSGSRAGSRAPARTQVVGARALPRAQRAKGVCAGEGQAGMQEDLRVL